VVSGDPDPTRNIYGSARFDYYAKNGSVLTAEAGGARVENELFVTGIGRVQVVRANRPYARLGWASDRFNVMAYFNGRNSLPWDTWEPDEQQYSLASGAPLKERSRILHIEGQTTERFASDKGRLVFGASARNYRVDTHGTLMLEKTATYAGDDHRSDYYYSAFGQVEYQLMEKVRGVAAARVDIGTLIDPQFSPKLAVVVTPSEKHSFRVTLNRAFQTLLDSSSRARSGPANCPPSDRAALPGAAPRPRSARCSRSPAVPVVAMGNRNLDVRPLGLGRLRADLSGSVYLALDAYYNRIHNFVTDCLLGGRDRRGGVSLLDPPATVRLPPAGRWWRRSRPTSPPPHRSRGPS
jgi:hypothetical protein